MISRVLPLKDMTGGGASKPQSPVIQQCCLNSFQDLQDREQLEDAGLQ